MKPTCLTERSAAGATRSKWGALAVAIGLGATAATSAAASAVPAAPGTPVDVAPWGERASWENGRAVGLWWEDPRDIQRVVVTFAEDAPAATAVKLQWWQSQWPERRIPRDHPSGASESGWGQLGDLHQGRWRDADAALQVEGKVWTYVCRPVNASEFTALKDFAAPYRTTMRVRLLFDGPAPPVEEFEAYTDSVWRSVEVGVEWGAAAKGEERWDGTLETFNAYAGPLRPLLEGANGSRVEVLRLGAWSSTVKEVPDGVKFTAWYMESPNVNTFDTSVITVRTARYSFSFDPAVLAKGGAVLEPEHGVVACLASEAVAAQRKRRVEGAADWSAFRAASEAIKTKATKNLYARVFDEPEQSLARALAEQPPRPGRIYLPLGTEGGRQRFGVNPDGSVFCVNDRIDQPPGKDTPRRRWGGHRLSYSFGFSAKPAKRWIEEESLPIVHTQWLREGIRYTETAFATRLEPGSLGFPEMHADDTTVLMVRVAAENLGNQDLPAAVSLGLTVDGKKSELRERDGLIYAKVGAEDLLRGAGEVRTEAQHGTAEGRLVWSGELPAGETADLVLKIPFITIDQPGEIERLRRLDFDGEFERVKAFWKGRADAGARIRTPIPELNRFYRAAVSHLLINCGREVNAERLAARVGSFAYGVYGNESCMMITDLDRRGFHREAERCLETFLHYQGTVRLPGDYASQAGTFNGANGWESGGYNQHHGWILWAMSEHYWYSGDRAWLERNAPKLIQACRWISSEREGTRNLDGLRRIERGLLPPGSLEDITDWRVWMSNNGFSWWGLDATARSLTDLGHPEAAALRAEAEAYRRDILAAFGEASVRAPLVALRDGSWIPQIPSEVHRRGRTFGWITTTLEGPIYFLRTGLLAPDEPVARNIMQDFEDNLYLSERYGYSWDRHGAQWFSRGGFSMQPNLLCSPHPYLLRYEIKHYLRAYFNGFAACYYPDTQMMCEHPLPDLGDFRGDHYKSSDESNSNYWLRMMFIDDERGDDLRLGLAIPRAWLADGSRPALENAATHFGPLDLRYESKAASGKITAVLTAPERRAPKRILLRFRHPEARQIQRVTVNGEVWNRFDQQKEWVELSGLKGTNTVVAFYAP